MRALGFITGHVIFKLLYDKIYQIKTTIDAKKEIGFKIRNADLSNFDRRWWSLYSKSLKYSLTCILDHKRNFLIAFSFCISFATNFYIFTVYLFLNYISTIYLFFKSHFIKFASPLCAGLLMEEGCQLFWMKISNWKFVELTCMDVWWKLRGLWIHA